MDIPANEVYETGIHSDIYFAQQNFLTGTNIAATK
jgi:hypothetical protein